MSRGKIGYGDGRWLPVADVPEYLQLSRPNTHALPQKSQLPCSKIARRWRFKRTQVDASVLSQRRSAGRDNEPGNTTRGENP